ncbi:unnamed protein product, partial [Ectocarpus fasciculatus]
VGNNNVAKVAHAAGWGVAGVLGSGPNDEDALSAENPLVEMCGPVVIDPSHSDYIGATLGSNNTAELTAIGEALIWLAHHCREIEADRTRCGFGPVVVRYDSDYAAKSVMGVYNGKKNVELIGQVRQVYADAQAALQSMRRSCGAGTANNGIKFSHVKGHSGHRWNERADELA